MRKFASAPAALKRISDCWQSSFFTDVMGVDPDEVWFGLCEDNDRAKSLCQTFLQSYVEDSVELRPCLGPQEYQWQRTVESAGAVLGVWRSLVLDRKSVV